VIGVVKEQGVSYLHDQGWRVLLSLRPGQRTPVFQIVGVGGEREAHFSVASWYLKLAGGQQLAPNWASFVLSSLGSIPALRCRPFWVRPSSLALANRCSLRQTVTPECQCRSNLSSAQRKC